MKNSVLTMVAIAIVLITACKKETKTVTTNIVPAPTLAGEWYGLYGFGTGLPTLDYYFKIRSNMTMKIAGTDTSTGYVADSAYSVIGDSLKCTYTYYNKGMPAGTFSIAAKFNKSFSFMSGTWGTAPSAYNGGSFYMGRKQQ